jgi:hypothetical protein
LNWAWLIARIAIMIGVLGLLFLSQRFWYRAIWRMTSNWGSQLWRVAIRLIYVTLLVVVIAATVYGFLTGRGHLIQSVNLIIVFAGLWFFSALFAYLAVKAVHGIDRIWAWLRAAYQLKRKPGQVQAPGAGANAPAAVATAGPEASTELLSNPSRRYFFKTATALAGAGPFLTAVYGFAEERLHYHSAAQRHSFEQLHASHAGATSGGNGE